MGYEGLSPMGTKNLWRPFVKDGEFLSMFDGLKFTPVGARHRCRLKPVTSAIG
jgi:hypothetical protein